MDGKKKRSCSTMGKETGLRDNSNDLVILRIGGDTGRKKHWHERMCHKSDVDQLHTQVTAGLDHGSTVQPGTSAKCGDATGKALG